MTVHIRPLTDVDANAIWRIFRAIVVGRDAYTFLPDTPREEGVGYWLGPGISSFVAEIDGEVVGMYKLIANHRGLGAHVANASFMVDPKAGGRGVGRTMGLHCLHEARVQGYDAMQFNFVVSTNTRAVGLWHSLGFQTVGTLPRVFRHGRLGLVDAYVMHRFLDDIVPTFGSERPGENLSVRHCAYGVLAAAPRDGHSSPSSIAIVRTNTGVLLPGGALESGEDAPTALVREVAEECALLVAVGPLLGDAVQVVGGREGRPGVAKHSRFFGADIRGRLTTRPDHDVMWLNPAQAQDAITNDSHRWAIRRWLRHNT